MIIMLGQASGWSLIVFGLIELFFFILQLAQSNAKVLAIFCFVCKQTDEKFELTRKQLKFVTYEPSETS